MASVEMHGQKELEATLNRLAGRANSTRLVVGYSAPYAAAVHERVHVPHRTGQAKFLEQPARLYQGQVAQIVADSLKLGKTLQEGLMEAGQFLLAQSRLLVPVATGFLRASGFVRVDP